MSSRLAAVSFDAADLGHVWPFWSQLLGREVVRDGDGVLLPGDSTQVGLRFVEAATERPQRNRLHLHLTSESLDGQRQIVDTALRLGARRRGAKPLPMGRDIYLFDPDGNEFCVIEPANGYLAGCGFLGEVTCNGTRSVGDFWQQALGWTVVWDEGDQLAIQSPEGGTKIGWDVWTEEKGPGWNRQRFELTTQELDTELARLLALGATALENRGDVVRMLDPDGSEFRLRAHPHSAG